MEPRSQALLALLRNGPVVFDGAMGTQLYERGLLYNSCFEQACETQPQTVRSIHEEYLRAGANVLKSNSFGANRFRLRPHQLDDAVIELNTRAAALAHEALNGLNAFVVGSVGPSGLTVSASVVEDRATVVDIFEEQIAGLLEGGVDGLSLETFRIPEELLLAREGAEKAFKRVGRTVPLLAQVSFDAQGQLADGSEPEQVSMRLRSLGFDAIGVNCATGPAGVYEMITRMKAADLPLVAEPNAGFPQRLDGRLAYMATPEYFLLYAKRLFKAGIQGVGGCCGTTPDHIRKVASAARMLGVSDAAIELPSSNAGGGMRDSERPKGQGTGVEARGTSSHAPIAPLQERSVVGKKIVEQQFVISVEVNPPPGLSLEKALRGAALLKEGGVDMINVADGARASARMSNLVLCMRIQETLNTPALMHVTTRDHNLLGLIAHLLGAHELGVHNLVIITGDPPKMGDYPDATAVYDLDSIGLLRLIKGLNRGVDPGGKSLGQSTRFVCATGAEPASANYSREMQRVHAKIDAGADFIMTQPVYDPVVLERFLDDVRPLNIPVLVGILPLASSRNAEFLHNEVPGMQVPEAIRERMRKAGNDDLGRKEGVAIAREMLQAVRSRVQGAYIMPPFGRYQLALDVTDGLR